MTQAVSTRQPSDADGPLPQPFGFASPAAPPLSATESKQPLTPGELPPPVDYAQPTQVMPPLAAIAPQPADPRDPHEPFGDTLPAPVTTGWDPSQPLPLSSASSRLGAALPDIETLPPPSGVPVSAAQLGAFPPPTGAPVTGQPPYPATPYPAGPPVAGPYQAANPYPANPYAAAYQAPAPESPAGPLNAQRVLQAANPYVLLLLLAGTVWPQLAMFTLFGATFSATLRKSPARVMLIVSLVICLLVGFVWYAGYFSTSQWYSTAQLLNIINLIGVPLLTYQSLRRRS